MGYIGSGPTRFNTADELTVTGDAEIGGIATVDALKLSETDVLLSAGETAIITSSNDVQIIRDGSIKLTATATGVDVTGTVQGDALVIDGNSVFNGNATIDQGALSGNTLSLDRTGADGTVGFFNSGTQTALISGVSGGGINAYVGSTPSLALAINASGSVGIGTATVATGKLEVAGGIYLSGSSNFLRFGADSSTPTGVAIHRPAANVIGFATASTERMRIDSSGAVVINNTGGDAQLYLGGTSGTSRMYLARTGLDAFLWNVSNGNLRFGTNNAERMRIISTGDIAFGNTVANTASGYTNQPGGGYVASDSHFEFATTANRAPVEIGKNNLNEGKLIAFRKQGTNIGTVGVSGGRLFIADQVQNTGISFYQACLIPTNINGAAVDNTYDCGHGSYRWDDIRATNGTIQTSDANEKQQIAALTNAEMTAAKAISALFKTFKWNDAVAKKGDAARTHAGVIAQDVEAAMTAAGLDAGDYAFFISDTWWETQTEVPAVEAVEAVDAVYEDVVIPAVEEELDEEGNIIVEAQAERTEQRLVSEAIVPVEAVDAYTRTDTYDTAEEAPEGATERTRMGIRYPELLAFVGAATEQRLANIETRLTALETA